MKNLNEATYKLFSEIERKLPDEYRMALTGIIWTVLEYHNFLQIIISRMRKTSLFHQLHTTKLVQEIGNTQKHETKSSDELEADRVKLSEIQAFVVLDTESFYLFSDILLDKSIEFLRRFFYRNNGIQWGSLRKFITSMNKDVETLGGSCQQLHKMYSDNQRIFEYLQKNVGDFRDDFIVHKESSRKRVTKGISHAPGSLPKIAYAVIYPTGREEVPDAPSDLEKIYNEVESYLVILFDFVADLLRSGTIDLKDVEL